MKILRWLILLVATVVFVTSAILLLNITAPNPTGRRYSSEVPLTTGQDTNGAIGLDAERILARDLSLPNNNDAGQRQCVCSQSQYASRTPGQCNVCMAYSPHIGNFRIPDFVGDGFIADSKNVLTLSIAHDNVYRQLQDMAAVAEDAGLALWVFVRVNTQVDAEYDALFDGIQGGIVPYFAVPGSVDPVDRIAQIMLVLALIIIIVAVVAWRRVAARAPSPEPPSKRATDPLKKAHDVEEFARSMKDRARGSVDYYDDH